MGSPTPLGIDDDSGSVTDADSTSLCSLAVQGAVSYNLLSSEDSLSGNAGISSSTVA